MHESDFLLTFASSKGKKTNRITQTHIYIIGKRLSQQDGKVVAEEAIDNHQQGAQEAEQPVEGGGDHTPLPLAHNPLYRDASREEKLGQEPNGVDE